MFDDWSKPGCRDRNTSLIVWVGYFGIVSFCAIIVSCAVVLYVGQNAAHFGDDFYAY